MFCKRVSLSFLSDNSWSIMERRKREGVRERSDRQGMRERRERERREKREG